jgi:(S)-ureidoglycine aminohydrolase
MKRSYAVPEGGLPPQERLMTGRAVFTESYAVIPRGTQSDIVTSFLPNWRESRFWVLARPMTGFSESFSHYIADVAPGGGSDRPEANAAAQAVLFVVAGGGALTIGDAVHALVAGSYAYIPAGLAWRIENDGAEDLRFHWIRKAYVSAEGVEAPEAFVTHEDQLEPIAMPNTNDAWATTRFVEPSDLRHDMHVNIVTFQPGGVIPFEETHVMEHGLYVLEGKAVYKLNRDWVEVEAGDYMWLRAFCPQACYAGGPGPFRYLLYKDVNRHMPLHL